MISYSCHDCGVLTTAEILPSSQYKEMHTTIISENMYLDYTYYIAWICPICININLNIKNNPNPIKIIPISNDLKNIDLTKINDENLVKLINEFYTAKTLDLNSAATLLARKILMHIVIEQKLAGEGENFLTYVDALKNSDIVTRNWKGKVDLIRKLGNEENHQIKIASNDELSNISEVLKNLLDNIYVERN